MVYLIHFSRPFHHAQHYIGCCWDEDAQRRFEEHKAGKGSRLLNALNKAGIDFKVVRTWKNKGVDFERKLKKRKKSRQLCPVCGKAKG